VGSDAESAQRAVTGFRYKAFISYSHRDEKWARWLQRSLESYRVPRRIVGTEGRYGKVPPKLAPVFRDREDLSSASDLSASVKQELAASETMIVICSPAATASPWVNEEILYFRSLGRDEKILALIVDGDPQSRDPMQQCFPSALIEGQDGSPFEPLAADARKWADGKAMARLKLVAGILGIRLDELRQRDMQRKHRLWMISAGGAMAIALLTSVLAIIAVTARNQAENRRQHAEELVDYMVDDLKEKLDEVGRLDILGNVGDEVSKYLDTLDPREETEESLLQKAKVWRQLGEVAMNQGKLDVAMKAFGESREVTRELLRRQPVNPERMYELGQAEFWVGYVHLEKGNFAAAREPFDQYLNYSRQLAELDAQNPEWIMELSYAHSNIAALINREKSQDVELALDEIRASVELNRRAIELDPENQDYVSEYGEALAWLADTQLLVCDLGGALESRQESLRTARKALEAEPARAFIRQRYGYALSGLSSVARQVGLTDYAIQNLRESANISAQLFAADPSNVEHRWSQLRSEDYIAMLEADTGQVDLALGTFKRLHDPMFEVLQVEEDSQRRQAGWVTYLLHYAEVAWMADEVVTAETLWRNAVQQIKAWIAGGESLGLWSDHLVTARFMWWHYNDGLEDARPAPEAIPEVRIDAARNNLSCEERSLLVLQALLDGDEGEARAQTEYLLRKGYFEPGFVRICNDYRLCEGSE